MKPAFSLALCALFACGAAFAAEPTTGPVAKVGNVTITQADIANSIATFPPQMRAGLDNPQGRKEVLDQLITFHLMAQSGADQGLDKTEEYKKALSQFRLQELATLAAERATAAVKAEVSDGAAQKFYDEHKAAFTQPEAVRASHILIGLDKNATAEQDKAAREKAEELIARIKKGTISFEEAAGKNSSCPSKTQGGDLSFFTKGQMVPAFEQAAFAMKKGEMSDKPVKTEFGYHIIKVTDRREASQRPFDEVKADIKADLAHQAQAEAFDKAVQALKAKYKVTIVDPQYK